MKTDKITVNKTPQQPQGVEIEVVVPENDLEARVLGFLLTSAMKEAKRAGRIEYALPERLTVEHTSAGTFVVSGFERDTGYYQPAKPLAVVGVRAMGKLFDLIHGPIDPAKAREAGAAAATPAAPPVPAVAESESGAASAPAATEPPAAS